ncbi:50S ribosomal protein L29 [Candidatus Micrarchaeota archaeon]|nr:50S ribosomal protein L29 [Candidatus Micrarchaeota archaeon]
MAIMKKKEMRETADAQLSAKMDTFVSELNYERGLVKNGGRTSNPGKIGELRRTIARMLTIMHERKESKEGRITVSKGAVQKSAPPSAPAAKKENIPEVKNVA